MKIISSIAVIAFIPVVLILSSVILFSLISGMPLVACLRVATICEIDSSLDRFAYQHNCKLAKTTERDGMIEDLLLHGFSEGTQYQYVEALHHWWSLFESPRTGPERKSSAGVLIPFVIL